MEGKTLAQIGAVAFVGVAITAAAIELAKPNPQTEALAHPVIEPSIDPLASELMRCQSLGEAGPRDATCLTTWAAGRKRFLAPARALDRSR